MVDYLEEAGRLKSGWGSAILVRDTRFEPDSPKAYTMIPIVGVRIDEARPEVELVAASSAAGMSAPRAPELRAKEVAERLLELRAERGRWSVFAAHGGREKGHIPIVGVAVDPDLGALLFIERFEGYQDEL